MWKKFVHLLVAPFAFLWLWSLVRGDGAMAYPRDPPITHGSGPDPDRILLLGDLIVRGIDVASYDLALSGHLARRLALRTGRGADVDTRGIARFDTVFAAEALGREDLLRFDAVVIMIGIREVMSLRPFGIWRRDIRRLLAVIADGPRSLPVLVVGVAPFARTMGVPPFVASWLEAAVERQNDETLLACLESGTAEYVPFTPQLTGIRLGRDTSAVYESWAVALVPPLIRALAVDAPARGALGEPPVDELSRQGALDDLGVVDTPHDASASRIVEMARNMLGMDAASLNFIDHDRQWSQASSGMPLGRVLRADAICATTIQRPGVFVVEDLADAPEFWNARWLSDPDHVRFYAGYPLEAPGGQRVGALCVMSRSPRSFSAADEAMLRDLALRAQRELWLAAPAA